MHSPENMPEKTLKHTDEENGCSLPEVVQRVQLLHLQADGYNSPRQNPGSNAKMASQSSQ